MEFIDSCVILKIRKSRDKVSDTIFSKSYTVRNIQEYEVKVIFHSAGFKEYRRYSQFLELREKVNYYVDSCRHPRKAP